MVDDLANEPAVVVSGVSKYFSPSAGHGSIKQALIALLKHKKQERLASFWAVRDVSFEVKKGEFFGIVGRNGSGKSTLLKMMAGVYSTTEGAIGVNGKLVPFIELGVGFNPELTGRDNVFLNGALLGFSRPEMTSMYDEIVEFAELGGHMDVKLKNFSSGMQVRLAFSIAIRAQSDILLIDEVLAVGDAAFQQKCFDYFESLKTQSKTVIFVTHDMNSVRRFCDRAVYIRDGKLIDIGLPSEISQLYVNDNFSEEAEEPEEKDKDRAKSLPVKIVLKNMSKGKVKRGSKVNVEIHLTASREIDLAVLSLSVMRDGTYLGGFNSLKYDTPLRLQAGTRIIKAVLFTDSLGIGSFRLGCGVYEKESLKPVGLNLSGPKITIEQSEPYKDGPANIDGEFELPL